MSRKSDHIVLALMTTALIGTAVYASRGNRNGLLRNQYLSQEECACDYGTDRCEPDPRTGGAIGPWYGSSQDARSGDWNDPGPGGTCNTSGRRHYGGYRGPIGIDRSGSSRSGFGSRYSGGG